MNQHSHDNCEHYEALIAASFDADGLAPNERKELDAHLAACASCRESFELSSRMEAALVSRRDDVPVVDSFLPHFAPATALAPAHAHPRLLAAFRALMSPAGISIALTMWAAMLALYFRNQIAQVFVWTSSDRFSALGQDVSNLLVNVSRGDTLVLTGIYVAITVIVLGSMGAITLRYVRHS
jgi:anti-sigma factor RsiW